VADFNITALQELTSELIIVSILAMNTFGYSPSINVYIYEYSFFSS
jgi:hypothetical protein